MVSRHLTGVERSSPRTIVMDASKCMGWKNLQCRTRYRVGGRQVQQALQLQTQGQGGDQETYPNDKHEVTGCQVLPTKVRACTHWNLPKTIRSPRGRQMLVVRRDSGPDAGAPLPPLQPVERPAESALESSGEGDGLESGQMLTRAGI